MCMCMNALYVCASGTVLKLKYCLLLFITALQTRQHWITPSKLLTSSPFLSFPFLSLPFLPSNPLWLMWQTAASPHLYYRPVVRLAQQLDDSWDTIVQPHSILGQFGILVTGGQMTQGTHRWLSNVLLLSSSKHSMNQCLHTAVLCHQSLRDNRSKRKELLFWNTGVQWSFISHVKATEYNTEIHL